MTAIERTSGRGNPRAALARWCAACLAALPLASGAQTTNNPPAGGRPYMLLTTDRVAFIRAKIAAGDPHWQQFTNQVNAHQGAGSYAPYGWLAADALLYRVTGATQYLADAQQKYNEYYAGWDYTDGSGLTYQWTCRYLCWGYDWLTTNLPVAVRSVWRQKILDAALYWQPKCYPKSYNDGISYRDTDHVSFLMENMLYSGLCLWGDDTNALTFVATSDDIRTTVILPYLYSNFYAGGYVWSGTMYGPEELKHVFRPLWVNLQSRGLALPGNYHDPCLKSLLLQTFPGFQGQVEYGDMHLGNYQPAGWSSEAFPPYAAFQTVAMLRAMSSNAVLRNSAQYWLNRNEAMIDRDSILNAEPWAIESLLFQEVRNTAAVAPGATGETLVDFAPSGYVSMRSSWDDRATALYFHNSEWNVDHQHMDCGHYTIVRNQRVVSSDLAGYWGGGYPACQDTLAHNAILIENASEHDGQSGVGTDLQAGVTQTAIDYGDRFGYVQGEYGCAYNYRGWNGVDMTGVNVVTSALRKILWVKPDLFLLHDCIRLGNGQPARAKRLVHHFQGIPAATGTVISCLSESNRTQFVRLLPTNATVSLVQDDTLFTGFAQDGIMESQKFWHVSIDAGSANATQEFLNVIQLSDRGATSAAPAATAFAGNGTTFRGTYVVTPGTGLVWMCRVGPGRTNRLDYAVPASSAWLQHVVTDVSTAATMYVQATPGLALQVAVRASSAAGLAPVKSSLQGTLTFLTAPDGTVVAQEPAFAANTAQVAGGSLQAAIDAAPTGGVLKVAAGTYAENVHLGKPLTLLGGYPAAGDFSSRDPTQFVTTLQAASAAAPVVRLDDPKDVTLDGLRIRGGQRGVGFVQNNWPSDIRDVTIRNNTIEQNGQASGDAYFFGGALLLMGTNVQVIGNTIRSNWAGKGGGIGMVSAANWTIADNTIEYNRIYSDHGGSMYLSGPGRLLGNTIRYNRSGDIAGYGWGGAFTTDHMTGEIASNRIHDNFVQSSGNVHIDEASSVTFHHNLVVSNRSAGSAAGLRVGREGASGPGSFVDLSFCTIAFNTSPGDQNAINLDASDTTVRNCILWGNGANPLGTDNTGSNLVTWSILDVPYAGAGNLTNNPLFVNAPAGDYHERSAAGRWNPVTAAWVEDATNSPAIDAGDPAASPAAEGAPNGGVVNAGVYGGTAEAGRSADTDGDGLSDALELARVGSLPNDADSDDDGDGDALEYVAGTQPRNAASAFRLLDGPMLNGVPQVRWLGAVGRRYRVWACDDLASTNWTPVGLAPGGGPPTGVVTGLGAWVVAAETNAVPPPRRFYRLDVSWP